MFSVGDRVRVTETAPVYSLAKGRPNWVFAMDQCLGREGVVVGVSGQTPDTVRYSVRIDGHPTWDYRPEWLTPAARPLLLRDVAPGGRFRWAPTGVPKTYTRVVFAPGSLFRVFMGEHPVRGETCLAVDEAGVVGVLPSDLPVDPPEAAK